MSITAQSPDLPLLSRTAEHALRAVLYLAQRYGRGPVSGEEIAAALGAPENYLKKTLQVLARSGIVAGTRGRQGGFSLAVAPESLSVLQVVGTFDDSRERSRPVCLLGNRPCDPRNPCAAHSRWTAITDETRHSLARTTVADLVSGN